MSFSTIVHQYQYLNLKLFINIFNTYFKIVHTNLYVATNNTLSRRNLRVFDSNIILQHVSHLVKLYMIITYKGINVIPGVVIGLLHLLEHYKCVGLLNTCDTHNEGSHFVRVYISTYNIICMVVWIRVRVSMYSDA